MATVNFGIDLGTTNSAIARMTPKGVQILPIRQSNYIPSVVAVDSRGEVKVGAEAMNPLLESARWFKRIMGTTNTVQLGDRAWTPQELSAEVLKTLRATAKQKTNEDLVDVVITVPAMFSQPQCHATNEAARLAGLNAVALVQEPIAAATAYLSDDPIPGYYLVYDLGGGTFDVSLIKLEDHEMTVIGHGGDNYLGGSDFDRTIFDWVLSQIEQQGGNVSQFEKDSRRRMLLQACENARIDLTDLETTQIYLDDFASLPFAKIDLTRQILEDLIADSVTRTIQVVLERVRNASLAPSDIRSILMVGGPTHMPYIRQRLEAETGIALNLDQDPMTVVAKGAAIHAGTILKNETLITGSSDVVLELFYDPITPEARTFVSGKVAHPAGFEGEIRLCREEGDWETGWIALRNGAFQTEVALGRLAQTGFRIEARDSSGGQVPISPSTFSISSGVRAATNVVPYNYSVVLEGGKKVHSIVKAGQPLPASSSAVTLKLARTIVAGSDDQAAIHFVEGNSDYAEDCVTVGRLEIRGSDIRRSLKEGADIEVKMKVDEKRLVTAQVYIPTLDEDFRVEIHSLLDKKGVEDLSMAVRETQEEVAFVEDLVQGEEQDVLMQAQREIDRLEGLIERVERGEVEESERVHKQLTDAKAIIRPIVEKYSIQGKHSDLLQFIDHSEQLCAQFDDSVGLAKLQQARTDADRALRLKLEKDLLSVNRRVSDLFWPHFLKTRDCWELHLRWMYENASHATNRLAHHELVRRAEAALEVEDYKGVAYAYEASLQYVPIHQQATSSRFSDAAVRLV